MRHKVHKPKHCPGSVGSFEVQGCCGGRLCVGDVPDVRYAEGFHNKDARRAFTDVSRYAAYAPLSSALRFFAFQSYDGDTDSGYRGNNIFRGAVLFCDKFLCSAVDAVNFLGGIFVVKAP